MKEKRIRLTQSDKDYLDRMRQINMRAYDKKLELRELIIENQKVCGNLSIATPERIMDDLIDAMRKERAK